MSKHPEIYKKQNLSAFLSSILAKNIKMRTQIPYTFQNSMRKAQEQTLE